MLIKTNKLYIIYLSLTADNITNNSNYRMVTRSSTSARCSMSIIYYCNEQHYTLLLNTAYKSTHTTYAVIYSCKKFYMPNIFY